MGTYKPRRKGSARPKRGKSGYRKKTGAFKKKLPAPNKRRPALSGPDHAHVHGLRVRNQFADIAGVTKIPIIVHVSRD